MSYQLASNLGPLLAREMQRKATSKFTGLLVATITGIIYDMSIGNMIRNGVSWLYNKYKQTRTYKLTINPIDHSYDWVLSWIIKYVENNPKVKHVQNYPNMADNKKMCDFLLKEGISIDVDIVAALLLPPQVALIRIKILKRK